MGSYLRDATLVHFAGHWVAYIVAVGFAAFFTVLWSALRVMPRRGWRVALRWIGFTFVAFAGSFYVYDLLVFEPVSPLVLGAIGAVFVSLFRFIRRKRRSVVG